jgi:hypothetical protein
MFKLWPHAGGIVKQTWEHPSDGNADRYPLDCRLAPLPHKRKIPGDDWADELAGERPPERLS